jgi:hypothetical protein
MPQIQRIPSAAVIDLTLVSQTLDFHMVLLKRGYILKRAGQTHDSISSEKGEPHG